MRRALQKLLALVLAAGLVASGPVGSCADKEPCGSAASHDSRKVSQYADLSVDPTDDASFQAELTAGVPPHDGLCQMCCAACLSANLPPPAEVALAIPSISHQMVITLDASLVERSVPTEPGIPKPL